ncbi:unnamed protein product [Protopolystoma xenopodis]|uniref:Protein kinase domain-containing protein n=1 Tax=Protopolystoma xenopodis TaxID=117903 RepID=A0A3S5BKY9_9PLAT|nr:unnamed protein product [Protopolystoma xenopodis]
MRSITLSNYAHCPVVHQVLMLTLQNDPPDIDTVATVSNQYVNYGQKFRKFTRACLVKDPSQRLCARELLNHHYIKAKAKGCVLLAHLPCPPAICLVPPPYRVTVPTRASYPDLPYGPVDPFLIFIVDRFPVPVYVLLCSLSLYPL